MSQNINEAVVLTYVENPENSKRLRAFVEDAMTRGAYLICTDGAGDVALFWNVKPDLLLGDMDSILPETLKYWQFIEGVEIRIFPVAKDETDLELGLLAALDKNCNKITIVGGLGGRLDQTLGNLYLLGMPRLLESGNDVRLLGEDEEVRLYQGEASFQIEGVPGETISLIPATASVEGIVTANLLYPLRNETLYFGPARGVSNEIVTSPALVSFKKGLLYVIHRFS